MQGTLYSPADLPPFSAGELRERTSALNRRFEAAPAGVATGDGLVHRQILASGIWCLDHPALTAARTASPWADPGPSPNGPAPVDRAIRSRFVVEVACFGETFTWDPGPATQPNDLRGCTFSAQGGIYPAGTIAQDRFDPSGHRKIGAWTFRGQAVVAAGAVRLISIQEFVLRHGESGAGRPMTIVTSGLEQCLCQRRPPLRTIIGGGRGSREARGSVAQYHCGSNTTVLSGMPDVHAPNFRLEFALR